MDSTATSLCMDNKIPLIVFGIDEPNNIINVVLGKKNWNTRVKGGLIMYTGLYKEAERKDEKRLFQFTKKSYKSIRAGRANPSLLDKITVDYYGQITPLKQVGSVSAPEPRLLVIQPWDVKLIPVIEKKY